VIAGILDLDYHYGNGTEHIIERLGFKNLIPHFSAGRTYTSPLDAEILLKRIPLVISGMRQKGCRVILYQAGADPHINDPLGGMMSTKQMRQRDRLVFEHCKDAGINVVWNLAGGYQHPLSRVIELHRNTMEECLDVYK
jgi:acetoin utilization deacetylase AcuC-like enzyme